MSGVPQGFYPGKLRSCLQIIDNGSNVNTLAYHEKGINV
jgi:hypothetical protein